MFTSLETGLGLDIVLAIQATANTLFDVLAHVLNFAGDDLFFMITLSLIYWSVNRQLGTRLLLALILGGIFNIVLKALFQTPRPYLVSNMVQPLFIETNPYGIPSGHVMLATVVWGYLALALRRWWLISLVVMYITLMGWARMYAGVHYPQDVVSGVVFGLLTLGLMRLMEKHFLAAWDTFTLPINAAIVILAVIVAALLTLPDDTGGALVGVLIGIGVGLLVNKALHFQFDAAKPLLQRIFCFLSGLLLLLVLFFGLRALFSAFADDATNTLLLRVLRYSLVAFVAFTVYPLAAARFRLLESNN